MRRILHKGRWPFAALALTLAYMACFWAPVLRDPDAYMFNTQGDGLKNYFTVAWHVKHDSTVFQFEGMNHPFGEQIDYIDAQPLLANTWRSVSAVFPALADHTVGVVNLFVVLGFAAAGLFFYLCLVELGCLRWHALLLGVGLAALSPQAMRTVMAHYSLATPWVLPAVIWVYLRMRRAADPLLWAFGLAGLVFMLYRHHAYMAVIASSWLGLRWCIALFRRNDKAWRWLLLCALLLPFGTHGLIASITDHHTDRTEHPTGFKEYQTNWDCIIRPDKLVHSPLALALLTNMKDVVMEGLCYIGLGNLLLLFLVGAFLPILWFKRRTGSPTPIIHVEVQLGEASRLLLCSIPLLMFAFGLPFDPDHMDILWNLPVVRQFRAPGRFTWPAWTALSLLLAALASALVRGSYGRNRWFAQLAMILAGALFLYEGIYLHRSLSERSLSSPNLFHADNLDTDLKGLIASVPPGRFRAILPLPYFHNGAEELMLPVDGQSLFVSQILAYHSGLPMMASSLGRTSISETRELIGLLAPGFYPHPLAQRFDPSDEFLVLWTGAELHPEDLDVLRRSEPVARSGPYELKSISAEDLFADRREAILAKAREEKEHMYRSGNWWFSTKDTLVLHRSFDGDPPVRHVYRGASALQCMRKDFTVLAELGEGVLDSGQACIASLWVYNRGPMRVHLFFGIDEVDPVTGQGQWHHYVDGRFSRVLDGDWSMVQLPFYNHGKGHRHRLFVTSWPAVDDTVWVDEVLIRGASTHVQRWPEDAPSNGQELLMDGHFVPLYTPE